MPNVRLDRVALGYDPMKDPNLATFTSSVYFRRAHAKLQSLERKDFYEGLVHEQLGAVDDYELSSGCSRGAVYPPENAHQGDEDLLQPPSMAADVAARARREGDDHDGHE